MTFFGLIKQIPNHVQLVPLAASSVQNKIQMTPYIFFWCLHDLTFYDQLNY